MAAVVEDDAILLVENDQPVGDALGRGNEAGLARAQGGLGLDPLGHVAPNRLDFDQPPLAVEQRRVGPLYPAHTAVGQLAPEFDRAGGAVWRQGCKTGSVPLAVLRDRVREFVEAAPEQLRPGPPEIPAIGIADEAETTVRFDPGDELVLGVDHRAVARLAGGQPVERLLPLRQRAGNAIEQGVDGPRQPAELVALMA